MEIKLPSYNLFFNAEKAQLDFFAENLFPRPYIFENSTVKIIILGNPVIGGRFNNQSIVDYFVKNNSLDINFLKEINGEFLLFCLDKSRKNFYIANDRFTSIPFYYFFEQNSIYGSLHYSDLVSIASEKSHFEIEKNNFFEFLWFRRVHNDITYDNKCRYLKSARLLTFNNSRQKIEEFWKPDFNKNYNLSLKESSFELSQRICNSLSNKLDNIGDQKAGFFLSGGMDTRTILAAFKKLDRVSPTCFTLGFNEEGEYRIAKQLTKITSFEHHFVRLPQNTYDLFWPEKRRLASGLHHQLQNIFLGLEINQLSEAEVFFHGHGLDYLFQGMYLPTKPVKIFNKDSHFKNVIDLNPIKDLAKYYCMNVPYRTWRLDVSRYLLPEFKENLLEELIFKIQTIIEEGKRVSNNNYDLWEYMMIHTISRHYSQTDVMGMSTYGEQRKIANDNDLFNFYLSLPLSHRLYARVLRGALRFMSPELANIPSANTGVKIDSSPFMTTSKFAINKALRTLTRNNKYRGPLAKDRTWPDEDEEVRKLPKLSKRVNNLYKSEHLRDALPYFNFKLLKEDSDYWLNQRNPGGGQFLMCLLSIEEFVRSL